MINEFTPRGSGNDPDLVELKVLSAGNMGGVVLYLGTPGSYDARFVFPPFEVEAGSFILVHLKPTGGAEEVDETRISQRRRASTRRTRHSISGSVTAGDWAGTMRTVLLDRPGEHAATVSCTATAPPSRMNAMEASARKKCVLARKNWWKLCAWKKPSGPRVSPGGRDQPGGFHRYAAIAPVLGLDGHRSSRGLACRAARKATFGTENSDEVYVPPDPK